MTRIFSRALVALVALSFLAPIVSTDAHAAVAYKFVDEKLGLSSGGGLTTAVSDWKASTAYTVGQVVRNGGFLYKCSVAGTSASSIGPSPNTLTDNTVTWVLGISAMSSTATETTQQHDLGYIAIGRDDTYGIGEFVYVKFTGNVSPGDFVIVDRQGKTAVQTPATAPGASKESFGGIAMGNHATAGTTADFGWVMIRGVHDQANVAASGVAGTIMAGSAVAGRATSAAQTLNYLFDGAVQRVAGVVGTGTVELYWPVCSGR